MGIEYPCLLRSMTAGIWACMYVHVHINRSMTSNKLSKLNNADIFLVSGPVTPPPLMTSVTLSLSQAKFRGQFQWRPGTNQNEATSASFSLSHFKSLTTQYKLRRTMLELAQW